MRKVSKNGVVYYTTYKKKRGRHKKPGPKKKPKPKPKKGYARWDFKIIQCKFNKQERYIGQCHDLEEVEMMRKILEERNAAVVFPKTLINNIRVNKKLYELKSEYVILKRNRDPEHVSSTSQLRNEYGKLIEHKTTSERWIVYDKFPCLIEETFWVYGYSPKTSRKDFNWIFEHFITERIENDGSMVNVYLYNNKVMFRYDDMDFNFVVCKNISDAIRMYNLIEERTKKNKSVIMTGFVDGYDRRGYETIAMIKEKTGWDEGKIFRKVTRK